MPHPIATSLPTASSSSTRSAPASSPPCSDSTSPAIVPASSPTHSTSSPASTTPPTSPHSPPLGPSAPTNTSNSAHQETGPTISSNTTSPRQASSSSSSQPSTTPAPQPIPTPPPILPPPSRNTHPMTTRHKNNIIKPNPKLLLTATSPIQHRIQTFVAEALKDPRWRQAMYDELNAIIRNGTYTLVPPEPSQNIVGTRWVFTIKYHPNGEVDKYKARFVAKGFHQHFRHDFSETFSPVIKSTTIRSVLQSTSPGQ